jgi:hypothetical protein
VEFTRNAVLESGVDDRAEDDRTTSPKSLVSMKRVSLFHVKKLQFAVLVDGTVHIPKFAIDPGQCRPVY